MAEEEEEEEEEEVVDRIEATEEDVVARPKLTDVDDVSSVLRPCSSPTSPPFSPSSSSGLVVPWARLPTLLLPPSALPHPNNLPSHATATVWDAPAATNHIGTLRRPRGISTNFGVGEWEDHGVPKCLRSCRLRPRFDSGPAPHV